MKLLEPEPEISEAPKPVKSSPPRKQSNLPVWLAALCIFAVGCFLRIHPWMGFKGIGFDEALYRG